MSILLLLLGLALGFGVGLLVAQSRGLTAKDLQARDRQLLELADSRFREASTRAGGDLDRRQSAVEQMVAPLRETLGRVEGQLHELERVRVAAYTSLTEQVGFSRQASEQLREQTSSLVSALKAPQARGRWGEMQLRRVVEMAGMVQRCDFDEQPTLTGDNGRQRPDLIVRLPGGKRIVVDAKAPLEAFLDAQDAPDDDVRTSRLRAHARQVRDHMDKLGGKAYWEPLGDSPEMVVMFLPGETLFSAALQHDLELIEHGLRQRVLLASPITLIALLTTVAHSWRQEALADNYREVARLGSEFYERLATFADRLDDVRKRLDGAVQAYNEAAGSFESRVLVSARRLKELKVTTADELPPAEPIDRVPRVLKQANLMGLPEEATVSEPDLT